KRRGKPWIRLGPLILAGDLVHGGDQRLRNELASERTEIPIRTGELARRRRDEEFAVHRRYAPGTGRTAPTLKAGKKGHETGSAEPSHPVALTSSGADPIPPPAPEHPPRRGRAAARPTPRSETDGDGHSGSLTRGLGARLSFPPVPLATPNPFGAKFSGIV